METKTQHGYLVLADISGYTAYLAGVELTHAHEILSDLLEAIVGRFRALLTISKLEGDAVFAYAPESKIPRGETLLELLESTYVTFRDRVETVRRCTTCQCNACRAIPTLDLKFFAHHGDYIIQDVAGVKELVGTDVNLAHRLMKNHIAETTGWHAYALLTEKALEHMQVWPEGAHEQTENYEHLGEVKTRSLNLHARYKDITEARRVFITREEADFVHTHDFAAPPHVVWDWMNDPQKRVLWSDFTEVIPVIRPGARQGAGARNHCMHGKKLATVETILDWRPFDYWTVELSNGPMLGTNQLTPLSDGNGTRYHGHLIGKMPMPKPLLRLMLKIMMKSFGAQKMYEKLSGLIQEDLARQRAAGASAAPETG